MVYSIPRDDRIQILKHTYETELISKAKDLGYQIVKLRKEASPNEERITELLMQIRDIIENIPYSLEEQFVSDGIETIFEETKKL